MLPDRRGPDGATTACEHLDRADAESPDDSVHIVCMDGRHVVNSAIFAHAATETARVMGDHGAVGEVRCQRAKTAGVHRLPEHEHRWTTVGGGQRALDVV